MKTKCESRVREPVDKASSYYKGEVLRVGAGWSRIGRGEFELSPP